MARSPRYRPAELLDLARSAIADHPEIPVLAFRAAHQIGSAEAQAVLTAARWEAGHLHYAMLDLLDLHPKYRELVRPRPVDDRTSAVSLDALPAELCAEVERSLNASRAALGATVEALRATAQRIVADVKAEAAAHLRMADAQVQDTVSAFDALERQSAEAREETARVREQLTADAARLTQELRDERAARTAVEEQLARADAERQRIMEALDRERLTAQAITGDLTRQLADAQRRGGAAEIRASSMEDALADARQRLTEATEAASRAGRDAAAAAARAELLETTHLAEIQRVREAHASEIQRLATRRESPAKRTRPGATD